MASISLRVPGASPSTMPSQESTNPLTTSSLQPLAPSQGPTPPCTPPKLTVVERALHFIRAHQSSYQSDSPYNQEDLTLNITVEEEEELRAQIAKNPGLKDFAALRLRYYWSPPGISNKKGLLTIRMTTHIHKKVALGVTKVITRQLLLISERVRVTSDAAVAAASLVEYEGDQVFTFPVDADSRVKEQKISDGAFCYNSDPITILIIEVGYTQDEDDLYAKSASFLQRTRGKVRTAIAIKIQPQSPGK